MKQFIRKMIDGGESEITDFKTSFGKEVIETLCAFANHKGGVVLVGVEDSGRIAGVTYGPETIQGWFPRFPGLSSTEDIFSAVIIRGNK